MSREKIGGGADACKLLLVGAGQGGRLEQVFSHRASDD